MRTVVVILVTCFVVGGMYLGASLGEQFWNSSPSDWFHWRNR